ncbi:MAG: rhodanese-like domain-containing protein [Campylobacterota bacterium]
MLKQTLVSFALALGVATPLLANDGFPHRKHFPHVEVIDTEKLSSDLDAYTVVDVRPPFEFSIMHIKGATNLPLSTQDFTQQVTALHEQAGGKRVVFYCNGHTCEKSYQAASRMSEADDALAPLAYDAGILEWAAANPARTNFLNRGHLDSRALISAEKFQVHNLPPVEFISRAKDPEALVVDIRDDLQRDGIALFAMRDIRTGVDMAKLKEILVRARTEGRSVFFFDATGQRVKHLQYLVEAEGLPNYFFMKGGMRAYFDMIQDESRKKRAAALSGPSSGA